MRVVLKIKKSKAAVLLEILESIPFVKVERKLTKKERLLNDLEAAVEELNQIKESKKQGKDASELLKEL